MWAKLHYKRGVQHSKETSFPCGSTLTPCYCCCWALLHCLVCNQSCWKQKQRIGLTASVQIQLPKIFTAMSRKRTLPPPTATAALLFCLSVARVASYQQVSEDNLELISCLSLNVARIHQVIDFWLQLDSSGKFYDFMCQKLKILVHYWDWEFQNFFDT